MRKLNYRYISRAVLQAETPLFIGSGESSLLKDALVQKDIHGFPMIQGTSLTGVLRHSIEDSKSTEEKEEWQSFLGYQGNKKEGAGSQIKISSAYLVLKNGKIAEGLDIPKEQAELAELFENLPNRQHVRITDKGVAKEHGLFDNEVVFKGTRFLFEIELKGDGDKDSNKWKEFINELRSQKLRVGQGTRNGYGRLSVFSIVEKVFDLEKEDEFNEYLEFESSLNYENKSLKAIDKEKVNSGYTHYKLELKPDDFFAFNAGYGDDEVDNIPITEQVITYDDKNSIEKLKEEGLTLIPATSIKGALSHRTAFYFNKKKKVYADKLNKDNYSFLKKLYLGTNNDAVYTLFGSEEGVEDRDKENNYNLLSKREGQRGKVIINDVFLKEDKVSNDKIFNHVAIDRFTGGAMDGALFSEKVSYFNDKEDILELNIYVEGFKNEQKDLIIESLEDALKDVCKGLLPLGGMTTKGHGMFTGKLIRNEENIYSYE